MLGRCTRHLDRAVESLLAAIVAAMVVVGAVQVFGRYALNSSLSWTEEFQRFCHIWLVVLAIPVGYNRASHIGMEVLSKKLPARAQRALAVIVDAAWFVLGAAVTVSTARLLSAAKFQTSAGLGLRMDWVYSGIAAGGVYLAVSAARNLARRFAATGGER